MDDLIVKYLRGDATDFETRRLKQWRAAAKVNEQEFEQVKRLWEKTADLKMPAVDPPPPITQTIAEAEVRRRQRRTRTRIRNVLSSRWPGLGLAVSTVILVLVVSGRIDRDSVESNTVLAPIESSSGPREITTMALTDGSVLRLARETRVEFLPSGDRRELVLEGKAFFAVARDTRPFVVRSQAGEVVVHGTRFEILTWEDSLRLVVVEGEVSLRGTGGGSDVGAGQVAFLAQGASPRIVEGEDIWSMLDWSTGLLVFQETPLSQVMREIGRHFGKMPQILDEEIGRRRVTAWFDEESLEEVIEAVCHVVGAHCSVAEGEVTVGR